nr:NAC domain-containing protein 82-like [Tanacetum cinerariifolium]
MKKLSPGFRFHPTDEELVMYFLKRKVLGKRLVAEVIAEVNIYDFSSWDLPDMSKLQYGDLEWFFFCPKSRKYSSGSRTNRATEAGYWKATGKDMEVKYKDKIVAAIKTLVFHAGHPPKGTRTDWVMHEYRMDDKDLANSGVIRDGYVLCKLFEKSGMGPKKGAQYGAPFEEEEWDNMDDNEVISFESSAMITTDTFNSNATMTNMTLIDPAPSTVTSSDNERLVVHVGANKTLYSSASGSVVTNMTTTEPGPSIVSSDYERRPSTITFLENETHLYTAANDDVLLDYELTDSILQITNTQVVEDCNGKPTDAPNGDDLIYLDLEALGTLDDLSSDGFDMFTAKGSAGFMADAFFADDLDDALGRIPGMSLDDGLVPLMADAKLIILLNYVPGKGVGHCVVIEEIIEEMLFPAVVNTQEIHHEKLHIVGDIHEKVHDTVMDDDLLQQDSVVDWKHDPYHIVNEHQQITEMVAELNHPGEEVFFQTNGS